MIRGSYGVYNKKEPEGKEIMNNRCPKCDYKKLKTWDELTEDEKMAAKVQPSKFALKQRLKHRFCVRCWYEEIAGSGGIYSPKTFS